MSLPIAAKESGLALRALSAWGADIGRVEDEDGDQDGGAAE